jgi:hypothetical protein
MREQNQTSDSVGQKRIDEVLFLLGGGIRCIDYDIIVFFFAVIDGAVEKFTVKGKVKTR